MTRFLAFLSSAALAAAVAGCATDQPAALVAPTAPAARCHPHGGLPDSRCTSGAVDQHVTQANIATTICVRGYTRTVRPPESYTEPLKRRQLAAYGYYAGQRLSSYEEDHLVPLEIGGAPRDPRNLWPEAHAGTYNSRAKDREENLLHRRVCDGGESLRAAQRAMARNWIAAYRHDLTGGG